jgi:predicted metalloprotease with PDZ domain
VADSSFDAWVKYYRQDENAPNAIVSYYTKGSLVALALDLTIRAETGNRRSLDDVMRAMWQRYGRSFYAEGANLGRGITEAQVERLFDEVTGLKLKRFFDRYVRGTDDLPLEKLLMPFGIALSGSGKKAKPALGIRTARDGGDCKLLNVYENGAAQRAGLSAGDVLVALDGLRVSATNLEALLARYRIGDAVALHAFRRDELISVVARLTADDAPQVALTEQPAQEVAARPRQLRLRHS